MEISDCIAQSGTDYVRIALQLVNDPQFRDEVRGKILARNHVLYEDETVVREFAQFFEYVVGAQLE